MTSSLKNFSKSKQRERYHYIYELPYPERKKLCQILDADGKWEELGGHYMKQSQLELSAFGRAVFHSGSPTSELLDKFGRGNGTIDQLFVFLSRMDHQWAMSVISHCVSPKYQPLLNVSGLNLSSSEICVGKQYTETPSPSAPSNSRMPFNSRRDSEGAVGVASSFSKLAVDPDNFNHSYGNSSQFPQKMPYLQQDSRLNGQDINVTREKTRLGNPVANGTASQTFNETGPNFTPKSPGAAPECSASPVMADQQPSKEHRLHDQRQHMKLNIPISQAQHGAIKKINKVTPSKVISEPDDSSSVMKIPYQELEKATDYFNREHIIGQGGFGIVYKACWKGNFVAVKKLSPKVKTDPHFAGQVSIKQSLTEMKVLNSCRIDNILPLYAVSLDGPEPCLVYQFMINGSLEDRLLCKGKSKPLSWDQRANIALGTAKGLNYLHSVPSKPLIHGDIKSANILLDINMEPKIGDFGLAREGPTGDLTHMKVSSVHGTQVYLPPEYLRSSHLSEKVDVFSYGIVLLEISTGLRAYNEKFQQHKHLVDYVHEKREDTDSLRDAKGGVEGAEWFVEILCIGKRCSAIKKASRPKMSEVLGKFDESEQKIQMMRKIRKLSKDMPRSQDLSPMDLQIFYDIRNGPNFFPNGTSGIKGPPPFVVGPDFTLPSGIPSIHPSEIREPPSMEPGFSHLQFGAPIPPLDSSLAATAGSNYCRSPAGDESIYPSSSPVPILTELGTNRSHTDSLSNIPERDEVVSTPKIEESSLSLMGNSDSDDESSSIDNNQVFSMTDIMASS